jgi:hypothetical protein
MNKRKQMTMEEAAEPIEILQSLCEILNTQDREHDGMRKMFRALVERWQVAPSLKAMFDRDHRLSHEFHQAVKASVTPSAVNRGAYVAYYIVGPKDRPASYQPDAARTEAVRNFVHLVLNPYWEKLAGPCARCGRYFVKSRSDHAKYCDGGCASSASAAVVMARLRRAQRDDQLERARAAAGEWAASASPLDWKEFVAQKLGRTKKWVTIAVTKYGLKEPRKGEHYGA